MYYFENSPDLTYIKDSVTVSLKIVFMQKKSAFQGEMNQNGKINKERKKDKKSLYFCSLIRFS